MRDRTMKKSRYNPESSTNIFLTYSPVAKNKR